VQRRGCKPGYEQPRDATADSSISVPLMRCLARHDDGHRSVERDSQKTFEFSARTSCVEKQMRIRDEPSGNCHLTVGPVEKVRLRYATAAGISLPPADWTFQAKANRRRPPTSVSTSNGRCVVWWVSHHLGDAHLSLKRVGQMLAAVNCAKPALCCATHSTDLAHLSEQMCANTEINQHWSGHAGCPGQLMMAQRSTPVGFVEKRPIACLTDF
jgi:hypothetical protein